jgi:hypothetical protein
MAKLKVKRTPVSGARNILTVLNQDPNYVYRWVNDTTGRIDMFKEGGYEVVTKDLEIGDATVDRGSKLGSAITRSVGGMLTAVLMRIPKEWYNEDQESKMAEIKATEDTMRQDALDGRYGSFTMPKRLGV